jgi:hypothetical protein
MVNGQAQILLFLSIRGRYMYEWNYVSVFAIAAPQPLSSGFLHFQQTLERQIQTLDVVQPDQPAIFFLLAVHVSTEGGNCDEPYQSHADRYLALHSFYDVAHSTCSRRSIDIKKISIKYINNTIKYKT